MTESLLKKYYMYDIPKEYGVGVLLTEVKLGTYKTKN